ncbi:Alpha/Beta hydrolase protein [Pleurostoma richardsiae]|uniref:Alpha/Beta hydrolase protein n=1 Tax=Pleurostoma richardsiae TaxID=41990 RepID=A0AA38RP49_9PEZI|nr:Alpha/Beta hydrolase protein [Pleurostoma richardsiae]
MVKEVEGSFKVPGASLYTKTWLPDGATKAKLVFIHGFSDHINRYSEFFTHLATNGIAVYGFDQRGWGRSVARPADKGLTGPTSQVMADVAAFVKEALAAAPAEAPLFVMGHSMGGGEVLTLASTSPGYRADEGLVSRVRGWLLESPFVGFTPEEAPSALKVFVGRLAGRFLPRFHLVHVIPPEHMSRDAGVVRSIREDPLMHNTGTLEGLAGLLDRTGDLAEGRARLNPAVRSVWVAHGDDDRAISHDASRRWYERETEGVRDRTFKTYGGWYHELHAEPGKEEFFGDVTGWILARSEPAPEGEAATEAPQNAAPENAAAEVGGSGQAEGEEGGRPEAKL